MRDLREELHVRTYELIVFYIGLKKEKVGTWASVREIRYFEQYGIRAIRVLLYVYTENLLVQMPWELKICAIRVLVHEQGD